MAAGWMTSWALSRKKSVSTTGSPRSCASSSSPVASGTAGVPGAVHVVGAVVALDARRQELLGALGAVALAPAGRRVVLDQLAQLEDPVHQRLGPRRAARDVD